MTEAVAGYKPRISRNKSFLSQLFKSHATLRFFCHPDTLSYQWIILKDQWLNWKMAIDNFFKENWDFRISRLQFCVFSFSALISWQLGVNTDKFKAQPQSKWTNAKKRQDLAASDTQRCMHSPTDIGVSSNNRACDLIYQAVCEWILINSPSEPSHF